MSYIECLASEYSMSLEHVIHHLPLTVGFSLLDARSARLGNNVIGYVERAIIAARAKCRRYLEQNFEITD